MYFLSRHCVDQIKLASFSLLFSRKNTDCPLKVVAILVRERLNSFRLTRCIFQLTDSIRSVKHINTIVLWYYCSALVFYFLLLAFCPTTHNSTVRDDFDRNRLSRSWNTKWNKGAYVQNRCLLFLSYYFTLAHFYLSKFRKGELNFFVLFLICSYWAYLAWLSNEPL